MKRLINDHLTPLLNDHHAKAAFFYYDRSLQKFVVHAGPGTKWRLQYFLENDAELKKAIKKDQDRSNRCNDADFVEKDMNKVRGRVPIARLEQNLEYLGLEQLSKYLKTEVYNDHVSVAAAAGKKPKDKAYYGKKEFEGPGVTGGLVQCLKENIRIFLQVNNIDPDSHVIQDYDKTTLNHKRRVRGEKFLHSDSSTAGSSISGSSTSGSLTSGSSSSDSSSSLSSFQLLYR